MSVEINRSPITLMSTADASRIYHIPARTIRRWHTEGRITAPVRDKGRLLWDAEQIDQLARLRAGRARLRRTNVMTHTP